MNFTTLIRLAVRSILTQNGPLSCSDVVQKMGLDPRNCKRTVHAIMVEMEEEGVISAERDRNGRRTEWFIYDYQIRKRDRLLASFIA